MMTAYTKNWNYSKSDRYEFNAQQRTNLPSDAIKTGPTAECSIKLHQFEGGISRCLISITFLKYNRIFKLASIAHASYLIRR